MLPYKVGDKITYAYTSLSTGVTYYLEGEVVFIDWDENDDDETTFMAFNDKQFLHYKRTSEYSEEFYEPYELPLTASYLNYEDDLIRRKYGDHVKYTWGRAKNIEVTNEASLRSILDDLEREIL